MSLRSATVHGPAGSSGPAPSTHREPRYAQGAAEVVVDGSARDDGGTEWIGVGVRVGKGVRVQLCPRCTRRLSPHAARAAHLCDACAADRRLVLRDWGRGRWWR